MTSRCRSVVVLLFVYFISNTSGSAIVFQSSSSSIKPIVSSNLTLRCSIHDTTPVASAVVGRSLTSLNDGDAGADDVTTGETDQTQTNPQMSHDQDRSAPLTNTTQNMRLVTSIIISRDGTDLATILGSFPAEVVDGASGFQVSGQLSATSSEKGFLELVWPHPTPADTGNFRCDIDTLSTHGHSFDFSQTLSISEEEVTINDIVKHLQTVELEKEKMQGTIDDLKHANETASKTLATMNKTIVKIESENAALKQSIVPDIFFSVAYTHTATITGVLIYDKIFVNEGGAYDNSTGTFTCPIPGSYHFEINVGGVNNVLKLILRKNGVNVITVYTSASGFIGSSNSAIVKLVKGDTMQVVNAQSGGSYVWNSDSAYLRTTLTGHLIALA